MGLQTYLKSYSGLKTYPMDLGKVLTAYDVTTQKALLSKFTIRQKVLPILTSQNDESLAVATLYYTIDAVLQMWNDPAGTFIPDFGDGKELLELFKCGVGQMSPGNAPEVMRDLIAHIDKCMDALQHGPIPVKLREWKLDMLQVLDQVRQFLAANQEVAAGYAVSLRTDGSPVAVGNAVIVNVSESLNVEQNEDLRTIVFADLFHGLVPDEDRMSMVDSIAAASGKAIASVQSGCGITEGSDVSKKGMTEAITDYLIEVRHAASNIRSMVTLCENTNCDMELESFQTTTSEDCLVDVPQTKFGWGDASLISGDTDAIRANLNDIFSMNQIQGKNIQYVLGSIALTDDDAKRKELTEKLKNSVVETAKWESAHENFSDIPVAHYVDTSVQVLETLTRNTKYAPRVQEAYQVIKEGIRVAMEDGAIQGVFNPCCYTLNSITPFPVAVRASQVAFNNIMRAETDEDMDQAMIEFAKLYPAEEGVFCRDVVTEGGTSLTIRNLGPLLANLSTNALQNGDFDKLHPRLLKLVDSCKSSADVKYLRKDIGATKYTLNKLKNNVLAVEKGEYQSELNPTVVKTKKKINKGLTSKKIDDHIKWLDEVYRAALNKKAKELGTAVSEGEEFDDDDELLESNKVAKGARSASRKVQKGTAKAIRNVGGTAHEVKQAAHNAVDPMEKYLGQMMQKIKKADAAKRREIIVKGGVVPKVLRWIKRSIPIIAGAAVGAHIPIAAVASGIALLGFIASDKYLDAKEKRKILRELEDELEIVNEKIDDSRSDSNKQKRYELIRIRNNLKRTQDRIRYNLTE